MEKPEITKVLYFTGVRKGPNYDKDLDDPKFVTSEKNIEANVIQQEHFVIPLQNIEIIDWGDDINEITLDFGKEVSKVKKRYLRCALSATDDPRCEFANDWSDLGCFRLAYKFKDPKITKNGTKVTFSYTGGTFKDLYIPDKVQWRK